MQGTIGHDRTHVVSQLVKAMSHFSDRDCVACPYNPRNHWMLIVFSVKTNQVFYLDSFKPPREDGTLGVHDFSEVKGLLDEYVLLPCILSSPL